jgi:hypothetical protein
MLKKLFFRYVPWVLGTSHCSVFTSCLLQEIWAIRAIVPRISIIIKLVNLLILQIVHSLVEYLSGSSYPANI